MHGLAIARTMGMVTFALFLLFSIESKDERDSAALARLSRRTAYLVWLDVPAAEARDGQRARGRIVAARSFERHARRAGQTSEQVRGRRLGEGWATTLRLDRGAAGTGCGYKSTAGRAFISENRSQLETVAPGSVRDYQGDLPNEPRTALADAGTLSAGRRGGRFMMPGDDGEFLFRGGPGEHPGPGAGEVGGRAEVPLALSKRPTGPVGVGA